MHKTPLSGVGARRPPPVVMCTKRRGQRTGVLSVAGPARVTARRAAAE